MSLPRLYLKELNNENVWTLNSLSRQDGNRAYDYPTSINESREKVWNQENFALTFPKTPQPAIKTPSELKRTVPRNENIKTEDIKKPAQLSIRHLLRRRIQRSSLNLIARSWGLFKYLHTPSIYPKKKKSNKSEGKKQVTLKKYFNKITNLHEPTSKSKIAVNVDKPKIVNESDKTLVVLPLEEEQSNKSKTKLEKNSESKYMDLVSMKDIQKHGQNSIESREMNTEFIFTKDSKTLQNNSDANSDNCSTCFRINLICYEYYCAQSMTADLSLMNYSQNNSKKPPKKDAKKVQKKSSDAESISSKDGKKDTKKEKKLSKKNNKKKDAKKSTVPSDAESVDSKDAKKERKKEKRHSKKDKKKKKDAKDTGSTDAESVDSKDAKKDTKKDRKPKKNKTDSKNDAGSTDAESYSELEEKNDKNNLKVKKDPKQDGGKIDIKKDTASTDADSESESKLKKEKNDENIGSKKEEKKPATKYEASTENESDRESKKDNGLKKAKMQDENKIAESMGTTSHQFSKSPPKRSDMVKSLETESEDFLDTPPSKKQVEPGTSIDSKKEVAELKKEHKMSPKKASFKKNEKKSSSFKERSQLPCESFLTSPKEKHLCKCKKPLPPPPKPRYAPLPEAKWIHKLL